MINRKLFKTLALGALLLPLAPQSALALKLGEVIKSSKHIAKHYGFKTNQAFHCGYKTSTITINKKKYEISTMRIVGLEGSKDYKNFQDLVTKLELLETESKEMKPYKKFPKWKTEVFHINVPYPKATILLSLRPLKS